MRPLVGQKRLFLAIAAVCTCATLAGSCRSGTEAPTSPVAAASTVQPPNGLDLRPVLLPDVSLMHAAVRAQVLERIASLSAAVGRAATPAGELASAYGELGKLFMAAEHVEGAESCLLNAETLAPGDRRWPYYLGHLYRIRGPVAKAAASFERALELRPDDVATIVWLGEVYLAQGRPEAAAPLFERALVLDPGSVAARFGAGRVALANKDYAGAVRHLEQALAASPHATAAHYPLALAYRRLGDTHKAETHLRQQGDIQIHPTDPLMRDLDELLHSPKAYDLRGGRALETGNFSEAAAYFRKGLELDPANPSLRLRLGTALFQLGDAPGALEQFEELVRTSPDYARGHYSLAVMLEANGRRQEAIGRFSTAVKHEPRYVQARVGLASALRRLGRLAEAQTQFEEARRLDPGFSGATVGLAITLARLERYHDARRLLDDALQRDPAEPTVAEGLARLLAAAPDSRVRDGRRALALVEELLKGQQTLEVGETLAMSLAELGRYDEAAGVQRNVIAATERAGLHRLARHLKDNLARYERREPCRRPWPEEEV